MARFVYVDNEYLNVDHIVSIDTLPDNQLIWIHLDTGDKCARSAKYLDDIVNVFGSGDSGKERCR